MHPSVRQTVTCDAILQFAQATPKCMKWCEGSSFFHVACKTADFLMTQTGLPSAISSINPSKELQEYHTELTLSPFYSNNVRQATVRDSNWPLVT